ncbi:hypothetical protein [Nisaea sp.]|nr:hypothetical protein [Nisaea sp.]
MQVELIPGFDARRIDASARLELNGTIESSFDDTNEEADQS